MPTESDQVAKVLHNAKIHPNELEQTIALGILVVEKYDKANQRHPNATLKPGQLAAFDHFSDADMQRFSSQAAVMLGQHAMRLGKPEPPPPPPHPHSTAGKNSC